MRHLYSSMNSTPATLVNSRYDHEACGLGFVASLEGAAQHDILRLALTALARLAHRGAVAADHKSSDGVGILTAIPRALLLKQARNHVARRARVRGGHAFSAAGRNLHHARAPVPSGLRGQREA